MAPPPHINPPPPPRLSGPILQTLPPRRNLESTSSWEPTPQAPSIAYLAQQRSTTTGAASSSTAAAAAGTAISAPLIVPEWQPDAAAKACPICANMFTFFNRRHHCRKCGRVVCAACSPHRIEIPSVFVVKPPVPTAAPVTPPRRQEPVVIDLTSSPASSSSSTSVHRRSASWGGGVNRGGAAAGEDINDDEDEDVRDEYEDDEEDDEEEEEDPVSVVRMCEDCLLGRRFAPPPILPSHRVATQPVPLPHGTRRRRRSSTQGGRSLPRPPPPSHHHHRQHPPLAEEDYCPICHLALPYITDNSERAREAHIESCILTATASPTHNTSRSAPSGAGRRPRGYTNAGRMVVWKATERDEAECVICFEEFEVGQEVARLECLCRYHKKCIKDWFDRKGSNAQCPVHQVHE
ncbi:hypothetical protein EX30DRAFT_341300 [Ascodesmis nigricans]|uniref:RING-type E3 ubiquitin transferase n=1 Tax=Ascodesmis nigricans TaxID=341454 RepID=A0A4V3SIM6_9PEZI|nr:hypothetical protein EX30DRAFT_341300 [Ascodesmis nigricans]